MKQLFFVAITLFLFTKNFGQITQVARKEIELDDEGVGNTTPVGDKGVLVHGRVERKGEPDVWRITQLDESFFEKNVATISIPDKYYEVGNIKSEDNKMLYLLFANKKSQFQLSYYNTVTLQTNSVTGAMPAKFYVTGMALLNKSLFLKGVMKKDQVLVVIDCESGKSSIAVLPGAGLKMTIQDMEPDNKQGTMAVSVVYGKGKKVTDKIFQTCFFNASGEKIDEPFKIQNEPGKYTISSSVTWLSKNHFLVSGSYSSD